MATLETTPGSWTTGLGRKIGIATAAAVVGNLVIFFIANALIEGSLAATSPGATAAEEIPAMAVVAASIIPVALGVVFLASMARAGRLRLGIGIVALIALVSIGGPVSSAPDAGSAIGLSLMHLVAAGAAIAPFRS